MPALQRRQRAGGSGQSGQSGGGFRVAEELTERADEVVEQLEDRLQ